jgi:hypothetical protein
MEPEGPQNLIQTLNFIKDGYITKKLSSLNGDPLDPTKKYIFVNDTNGRMHGVYGVADANVVAGAVNLSEPLLANTPTVFFDHTSDYMHNYNAADFKKMADQAQATGGAFAVDGIASMNQKLSEVLSTTKPANIAPPYSVKLDGQTTPVDNYVSALTRSLGEAANKEDAFSKAHIPAAGLKVYVRSKLSQLEEIARTIESPEVPLEKKTLAAAAFKTHTFSPGILSALSPEELKALKNTSARLRTEAVKIASQNPDFATQAAQVLVRTDRLLSKKSGRAGISKETLNFIEDLKKRNAISEKSVQELEKLMN